MKEIEMEAKTVAEAVDSALKRLGLRRDQVEVQVVQEPSSGFIGFGSKPARVKLTEKRWGGSPLPPLEPRRGPMPRRSGDYPPAETAGQGGERPERAPSRERGGERRPDRGERRPARGGERSRGQGRGQQRTEERPRREEQRERPEGRREPRERAPEAPLTPAQIDACSAKSKELLEKILSQMLFDDAKLSVSWDAKQERVRAEVATSDSKRLIGPEGRTLEALQFLVTLMVGRKLGAPVAVQVDCESFWAGRENAILSQAQKGVESVRATGKPYRLEPMDAQMRRLIHRSLAGTPGIVTSSEGDGAWRKIVLRPAR